MLMLPPLHKEFIKTELLPTNRMLLCTATTYCSDIDLDLCVRREPFIAPLVQLYTNKRNEDNDPLKADLVSRFHLLFMPIVTDSTVFYTSLCNTWQQQPRQLLGKQLCQALSHIQPCTPCGVWATGLHKQEAGGL